MITSIVVSILGPDRPGLVQAISDCAGRFQANWADSVMATFAGQFAGVAHLQVDSSRADALLAALQNLGLSDVQVITGRSMAVESAARRTLALDLVGNDRPGIIHSISSALAGQGVSIHKLQTHIASAPMAGGDIFHMHALLQVPETVSNTALREALEGLANELMVDVSIDGAN